MIERFASGSRFEPVIGYSRAVKAGPFVFVAGCTGTTAEGEVVAVGDAYEQMRAACANVERALALAGASLEQVVQTRMYVTDVSRWEEIGRAHAETFGTAPPVSAMIGVEAFIDPRMLVEVEAVAYVS